MKALASITTKIATCVVVAFTLSLTSPIFAEDEYVKAQMAKIDAFTKALSEKEGLDEETKKTVGEIIDTLKGEPAFMDYTITEALQVIYPKYKEALDAWDDYEEEKAMEMFNELAKSEDPFMKAAGAYSLGRALMSSEDFESALLVMKELSEGELADYSLQSAEAMFYGGYCHSRMLNRDKAVESLRGFIDQAAGTAAMSASVRQQAQLALEFLQTFEEGSLSDVAEHMEFSGRRLDFQDPGDNTQEKQDKIIAMRDELIKKAEEQESSSSSSSSSQSEAESAGGSKPQGSPGQPKPGSPGGDKPGQGTPQAGSKIARVLGTVQQSPWDMLRDRVREPDAFLGLQGDVPARYRALVEQYHSDIYTDDEDE